MQSWTIVSAAGVLLAGWAATAGNPLIGLSGAVFLALAALLSRRRWLMLPALFLLGLAYGAQWSRALLEQRLSPSYESLPLAARVTVLEPPQLRTYSAGGQRQRFVADVVLLHCPDAAPGCNPRIGKVLLAWYGRELLRVGDVVRAEVMLRRPRGLSNPGSFNFEAWLARHRYVATGHMRGVGFLRLDAGKAWFYQRWRQALKERLHNQAMDNRVRGVLLALTTGDRSGFDGAFWQTLQRFGLNHLVVVSGLHVGLVAGIGFLLGRLFSRRGAHLTAAALALAYSALAGFSLPTQRALVMLASVQLAAFLGRETRPWRSFGLALLMVSVLDPLASHSAGFWLSFGAVALIFVVQGMRPGWPAWRLTLLLQAVLSPVMGIVASFWFGGLGWLAPLANLVAVPVLTFWLAPLCLLAAGLAGFLPDAAAACWQLAALPVEGFLHLDEWLGSTPMPLWLHYRPALAALLCLLAASFLLVAARGWPQRWLAGLFLLAALSSARDRIARDALDFWVLDVGQGLAAVVRYRDRVLVFDTGAGDPAGPNMATGVIIPFLERYGVERIDLLVISHGDIDHAGGVYSLHRRFPVAETWYGDDAFDGLRRQRPCRKGMRWQYADLSLHVLSPTGPGQVGNNASCVILLQLGNTRVLLPGDIDASVERELVRLARSRLPAKLLIVPHHGSRSSSSSALLTAVGPQLALVSRGYGNRFSHPHPEVVLRYRRLGVALCDTAVSGALNVELDGEGIRRVDAWRRQRAFYWAGPASPACAPAYNDAQKVNH